MDRQERIEAAQARLDAGRSALVQAAKAGPPCAKCVHHIPAAFDANGRRKEGPFCGHLVHTEHSFSYVSGALSETVQVPSASARRQDGLCGPEGLLFEARLPWIEAVRMGLPVAAKYGQFTFYWLLSGLAFWWVFYALVTS